MIDIRTILVPVDFSECSPAVVADAAGLATKLGAELVLLNVVEPPAGVPSGAVISTEEGPKTAFDALVNEAVERLEAYDVGSVPTQRVTWRGKPVESILEASRQVGANLLVMGTHGRKGVAHLVLGSVAERVVRESEVPVLTIRAVHRPGCQAGSCNWCQVRQSHVREQLAYEADG